MEIPLNNKIAEKQKEMLGKQKEMLGWKFGEETERKFGERNVKLEIWKFGKETKRNVGLEIWMDGFVFYMHLLDEGHSGTLKRMNCWFGNLDG